MIVRGRQYNLTAPMIVAATATTAAVGTGAVYAVTDYVPLVTALGLLIGAIATAAVAIITALGKNRQATLDAAAEAALKLEAIKHSVDGATTKLVDKNDAQAAELKDFMLSVLAEKEKRAEVLAAAAAAAMAAAGNRTRGVDLAPPAATADTTVAVDEAIAKLKKIDDNTKATADNTATTKADVKQLKRKK